MMNNLPAVPYPIALRIADITRDLYDLANKTGNLPRLDLAKIAITDALSLVSGHEETIKLKHLLDVAADVLDNIEKERLQHIDDLKMELFYLFEECPHLKPTPILV